MTTKNVSLADIPHHISPLVRQVYGLFKSFSTADELAVLAQFAGRNFAPLDEVAMAHLPARIHEAFQSNKAPTPELLEWALTRRETTNYTYELEPSSIAYLTSFVATTTGIERTLAERYIRELEEDQALRVHLQDSVRTLLPSIADPTIYYGRRLGWYALARAQKPKTIVETGIDKGMGSCVLCAALIRNAQEGAPGRYYGIDVNPKAGACFGGEYARVGEIIIGDSANVLSQIAFTIDFLIADSSHAEGYEGKEYAAVRDKLSTAALVISDADFGELANFAISTGRKFLFWPEWPKGHFYRGSGIALAY